MFSWHIPVFLGEGLILNDLWTLFDQIYLQYVSHSKFTVTYIWNIMDYSPLPKSI